MSKLTITERYGVAPNEIINDPNLSLKAKGLFLYIQSKPDDWEFSAERIMAQTKDGLDSVKSGLQELEAECLLKRLKKQNEDGTWVWEYVLCATVGGLSVGGKPTGGLSTGGKPTNTSNKDTVNKNSKQDIEIIPVSGNTPLSRLKQFYSGLFKHYLGAEPRVMLNGKDGGVLKSLLKQYSEVQIAALMVNHFNWYGPSGNDDRAHQRVKDVGYPIPWISPLVNEYIVYTTEQDGVNFTEPKEVYDYVRKFLKDEGVHIG